MGVGRRQVKVGGGGRLIWIFSDVYLKRVIAMSIWAIAQLAMAFTVDILDGYLSTHVTRLHKIRPAL